MYIYVYIHVYPIYIYVCPCIKGAQNNWQDTAKTLRTIIWYKCAWFGPTHDTAKTTNVPDLGQHMRDMTHLYLWHDSFLCVTWLIYTYDVTHTPHTRLPTSPSIKGAPNDWQDTAKTTNVLALSQDATHATPHLAINLASSTARSHFNKWSCSTPSKLGNLMIDTLTLMTRMTDTMTLMTLMTDTYDLAFDTRKAILIENLLSVLYSLDVECTHVMCHIK